MRLFDEFLFKHGDLSKSVIYNSFSSEKYLTFTLKKKKKFSSFFKKRVLIA